MSIMFPNGYKCVVCGDEISVDRNGFCDKCIDVLPKIVGKVCNKCGLPLYSDADYCMACKTQLPSFTKAFAPYRYEGVVKNLIHKFKYDGAEYLGDCLGKLLYDYFVKLDLSVDVIIPVPLYLHREFERGFNQASALCGWFAKSGFDVDNYMVVKTKNSKMQASLSLAERKENISGAFRVLAKNKLKNKVVLLVDDVYTSGSTFGELADVVLKAGASKVYCLSLARTCFD